MFFNFDLLFTLRANQTLAKLKCLSNFSSEYQNSYNCREKKQYSHKTSRFFMTTKYFRNLCRVRCIYIFMYWEMIKPKNHCFSKMFDMQTILVLDQKLIKVLFILFDINFVESSKLRISRIRQSVHNSLTNRFCCHVSYHVKHKLKQLTKNTK